MSVELGKRIKSLRKNKGLTQEELSRLLDKTTSCVGMYETGVRQPGWYKEYIKLAEILECSVDYLMGRDNYEHKDSDLEMLRSIQTDIENYYQEIKQAQNAINAEINNWTNSSKSIIYSLTDVINTYQIKIDTLHEQLTKCK